MHSFKLIQNKKSQYNPQNRQLFKIKYILVLPRKLHLWSIQLRKQRL